jgi:hypothetical protein
VDSHNDSSFLLRFVVNSIYAAGAVSSVLVGAYGVFLIMAPLLVAPGLLLFGATIGLPIIVICLFYLTCVLRLLFSKRWEPRRYNIRSWALALLGVCVLWGIGLLVAYGLRGI